MADFVFNIAMGKVSYYAGLPAANDALIAVLIETSGLEADATLKDYDTLSALLAGTSNEPSGGTYARKTLGSVTVTVDDTNDRVDVDCADPVWTALTTTGNAACSKLLICYDGDTTSGTDADIIPLTCHDFSFTPDGTDVTGTVAAAGFFRAS